MIWWRSGEKKCARPDYSKSMHPRNGIEGTHSELVRGHGLRRTKYRGLKPSQFIALRDGGGLQCETISKSARFPDENSGSEPRLRARSEPLFLVVTSLQVKISLSATYFVATPFPSVDRKLKRGFSAESFSRCDRM